MCVCAYVCVLEVPLPCFLSFLSTCVHYVNRVHLPSLATQGLPLDILVIEIKIVNHASFSLAAFCGFLVFSLNIPISAQSTTRESLLVNLHNPVLWWSFLRKGGSFLRGWSSLKSKILPILGLLHFISFL